MMKTILASLIALLMISPAIGCDKPIQFKLNNVKKDSSYSKMGLMSGDVIVKIDGKQICDMKYVKDKFTNLFESKKISFEVIRNGKNQKIDYAIAD